MRRRAHQGGPARLRLSVCVPLTSVLPTRVVWPNKQWTEFRRPIPALYSVYVGSLWSNAIGSASELLGGAIVRLSTLRPANQMIVFRVCPDPEPNEIEALLNCERSVVDPDTPG